MQMVYGFIHPDIVVTNAIVEGNQSLGSEIPFKLRAESFLLLQRELVLSLSGEVANG
jgi:hypothetical protein